jgi:succinate dehydrogenase/fumarate reductase-like Fe-S protein
VGRSDSLAKLAWAYGLHLARRRLTRPKSQLPALIEMYKPDGIRPLTPAEREMHPRLIGCINCGLCALAAGRMGKTRLPDLASSYMRLYARLADASSDLEGDEADLKAASAACPVGLPLTEVAAVVRRLAAG